MQNQDKTKNVKAPKSFWISISLMVIWNLMGAIHFIDYMTTTVERLVSQGMTIEQAEFFLRGPSYIGIIFGLGVWSGLLGSALLAFRKSWATLAFSLSAAMTFVSFVIDGLDGGFSILGPLYFGIISFTLMVALFEIGYSRRMKVRGILK